MVETMEHRRVSAARRQMAVVAAAPCCCSVVRQDRPHGRAPLQRAAKKPEYMYQFH